MYLQKLLKLYLHERTRPRKSTYTAASSVMLVKSRMISLIMVVSVLKLPVGIVATPLSFLFVWAYKTKGLKNSNTTNN